MKITNDNQLTDQHKPPEEKDVETLPTDLQLPEECTHQLLAAVFPKHYHFTHRALCEIDTKWASIQNDTIKERTSGGYSRRPDQMAEMAEAIPKQQVGSRGYKTGWTGLCRVEESRSIAA